MNETLSISVHSNVIGKDMNSLSPTAIGKYLSRWGSLVLFFSQSSSAKLWIEISFTPLSKTDPSICFPNSLPIISIPFAKKCFFAHMFYTLLVHSLWKICLHHFCQFSSLKFLNWGVWVAIFLFLSSLSLILHAWHIHTSFATTVKSSSLLNT